MAEYKHHLILIGLVVVVLLLSNYTTTVVGRWIHHQYLTDDHQQEKNKKPEEEAKRSSTRYTIENNEIFRMYNDPLLFDMNNNPVYGCRKGLCVYTGISIDDWRRYEAAVKRPHGLFVTDDDLSKCRLWLDLELERNTTTTRTRTRTSWRPDLIPPPPPPLEITNLIWMRSVVDSLNDELIRDGVPARIVMVPARLRRRREADDVQVRPPYRRTLGWVLSEFARSRAEANSRPIFRFRSDPNWKKGMPESRGGTRIVY